MTEVVTWEQTNDGVVPIPTPLRNEGTKLQFQELIKLTDEHFLHQLVTGKTSRGGHTLDLVFTNSPNLFHSMKLNITTSDYKLITLQTDIEQETGQENSNGSYQSEISKYCFKNANKAIVKRKTIWFKQIYRKLLDQEHQ